MELRELSKSTLTRLIVRQGTIVADYDENQSIAERVAKIAWNSGWQNGFEFADLEDRVRRVLPQILKLKVVHDEDSEANLYREPIVYRKKFRAGRIQVLTTDRTYRHQDDMADYDTFYPKITKLVQRMVAKGHDTEKLNNIKQEFTKELYRLVTTSKIPEDLEP